MVLTLHWLATKIIKLKWICKLYTAYEPKYGTHIRQLIQFLQFSTSSPGSILDALKQNLLFKLSAFTDCVHPTLSIFANLFIYFPDQGSNNTVTWTLSERFTCGSIYTGCLSEITVVQATLQTLKVTCVHNVFMIVKKY